MHSQLAIHNIPGVNVYEFESGGHGVARLLRTEGKLSAIMSGTYACRASARLLLSLPAIVGDKAGRGMAHVLIFCSIWVRMPWSMFSSHSVSPAREMKCFRFCMIFASRSRSPFGMYSSIFSVSAMRA